MCVPAPCTDLVLRLYSCALDDPGHRVPGDVLRLQVRVCPDLLHDLTWVTGHDSNVSRGFLTMLVSKLHRAVDPSTLLCDVEFDLQFLLDDVITRNREIISVGAIL